MNVCCQIIGCFNPNTVGDYLWREFPTLRCLMQMVITGRYVFPPVDAQDPLLFGRHKANFADLVSGNLQLRDYEQQVLQHSQHPALFEDPPMVLEADGIAREPPPAILEHLRSLDLKFKLGTRLRQSRASDFLMEMVTGNDAWSGESGSPESVWWIADIVCEDFETVQYLPHGCLCKLLLLAFRSKRSSSSAALPVDATVTKSVSSQRALNQIIPRLLAKLREYLSAKTDNSGTASNIVLYYLDCLTSPDVHTRRVASQILLLLTLDDDNAQAALARDDELPRDAARGASAMSFAWLPALVKLPCYAGIRERIFWSLESVLERESSVESLTLCVKALHAFWQDNTSNATDIATETLAVDSKQRNTALEQTLVLAGALGKLLSTREFIAKFLLEQRDVYAIVLDVFWAAMKHQLSVPPSLKSKMGVSFSDCKVFYVADGSSTVREIKLPLHVIHGAIHVLCSPHAHDAAGAVSGVSVFSKLKLSLFPKAAPSGAIISSTGLIATKDARLYPDHLLMKLASSSPNAHMCASAVRAMKSETLWTLLLRAGLRELCLGQVLQALSELTKSSESKAEAGLTAATETQSVSDAARVVLRHLRAFSSDTSGLALSKPVRDQLQRVQAWLTAKTTSSQSSTGAMDVDESADEQLLCKAFATTRLDRRARRTPAAPVKSVFAKFKVETAPATAASQDAAHKSTDDASALSAFKTQYFQHQPAALASVDALLESSSDGSNSGDESFASMLTSTATNTCPSSSRSTAAAAATDLWSVRIALLQSVHGLCKSSASAPTLARALLGVIDHITTCSSASHRRECCAFVRQALDNVAGALSYAAAVAFVQSIVQVGAYVALDELHDVAICRDVEAALRLLVAFVSKTLAHWHAKAFALQLDALAVQSLVVLVKDVEVLRLARSASHSQAIDAADDDSDTTSDLLVRFVQEQQDASVLVSVLDAVLTADPDFVQLTDVLALHVSVRRDLIGVRTAL